MKKKHLFAIGVITLIVLAVAVFFAIYRSSDKGKYEKIVIAQAGNFFLYAPIYIAKDAGFFKNQGLDVNIISTGGDDKTWAAVIGGNAQFGVADPTFIVISSQRGEPGRVVANIVNGVPFWGITFKNIKPFNSSKDLKGHTVATFPSPSTAYTLQKQMFIKAGLKPNIKQGAFGTILAILKSNNADIGLELEPNVSLAQSEGATVLYSMAKIYGDFAITGLTTTPQIIKNNPQLVQKVVNAIQSSLNFIRNNPKKALSFLRKRFPEIKQDIAKKALERVLKENIIPKKTIIEESAWDKAIKIRIDAGDIKQKGDFTTYIDNNFSKISCNQ